jgi:hypothetical protein
MSHQLVREKERERKAMGEILTTDERLMTRMALQMSHNLLLRLEDRPIDPPLASFPPARVAVLPAPDVDRVEVLREGVRVGEGLAAVRVAAGVRLGDGRRARSGGGKGSSRGGFGRGDGFGGGRRKRAGGGDGWELGVGVREVVMLMVARVVVRVVVVRVSMIGLVDGAVVVVMVGVRGKRRSGDGRLLREGGQVERAGRGIVMRVKS